MSFRISARTILALGADLISTDAIAIYELVKNAIDAGSKNGVEIHFVVTLGHTAFLETMAELGSVSTHNAPKLGELARAKEQIVARCIPSAMPEMLRVFGDGINSCKSLKELRIALPKLYQKTTRIEFRDNGHGMSAKDLYEHYLVIGTPCRKRTIDAAEEAVAHGGVSSVPFLGEKGVGRLSAMRLGSHLHLETATLGDKHMNVIDVDWRDFDNLELFIDDEKIDIKPTIGDKKPAPEWSGTNVTVSMLESNWSPKRIREVAIMEFSRITDPFSFDKRRFRIAVFFNGDRVDIPRLDDELLRAAHATVKANYVVPSDGPPTLEVDMMFKGPERVEKKQLKLGRLELKTITHDPDVEIPASALRTVGPFRLEAYWYNRQKLSAINSVGNLSAVRELQKRWSGIMLYRDDYRVFPYGEDKDDWLGLDRKALGSKGYKLSKVQFVGRAQISRLLNPRLLDQTNREGLKSCPENHVFVELIRYVIYDMLKPFMEDIQRQQQQVEIDLSQLEERVSSLEARATRALQDLKRRHNKESGVELQDLLEIFREMKEHVARARQFAEQAEDERTRLVQLAGVGLMLEVIAHELARSTETAMKALAKPQTLALPGDVAATLKVLRSEMQTMNKRIRVLDPLSVSARQRRETFDIVELIRESFAGRKGQFDRHGIRTQLQEKSLIITGVKGMYVQIIENLISNSVFWLGKRAEDEPTFQPIIRVVVELAKRTVHFSDNGPGIDESLRDEIFKPFFSTKDRKHRQGLGLYIARECATHNDAQLILSDKHTEHKGRLNTFALIVGSE